MINLTNPYHETDFYELDQHADQILSKRHRKVLEIDARVIEVIVDQFETVRQYVRGQKAEDLLFDALCEVATIQQIGDQE